MLYKYGTVKWFNAAEGKRYGFLIPDQGGPDIFFHLSDGRLVRIGETEPQMVNVWEKRDTVLKELVTPMAGDRIVYYESPGKKGPKASPWVYAESWDLAVASIASRPIYRAMEQMNSTGEQPTREPEILWEGPLSRLPRKLERIHGRSPSADPMLPYWSHDDGFEIHRWWEMKVGADGQWERCKDPR